MATKDPFAQYATSPDPFAAYAAPAQSTGTGTPSPGIRQPLPDWLAQMIREGGPSLLPIAGQIGATMAAPEVLPLRILAGGAGFAAGEGAKMLNTGDYSNAGPRLLEALGIGMGSEALPAAAGRLLPRPAAALQRSFGETGALAKQFPQVNLGEAAIEGRVAPGAKGAARALKNVQADAQASSGARMAAQKAGRQYTIEDLSQPQLREFEAVHGRPPNQTEKAGILRQTQENVDAILSEASQGGYVRGSTTYQPSQVYSVARRAGKKGQPVARGAQSGQTIPATDMSLLSQGGREALGSTIPGYDALQAQLQKSRAVNIMAQGAKNRPMPWYPGKVNVTQFPPNASLRPDLTGQLALLASSPWLRALLAAGRYGAGGALQHGLDQPPDTTGTR